MSALHEVVKLKRLALETHGVLSHYSGAVGLMSWALKMHMPMTYEMHERRIMKEIGVKDEMLRH